MYHNKYRCFLAVLPAEMYHRGNNEETWIRPQCFELWVCCNIAVSMSICLLNIYFTPFFHRLFKDFYIYTSALFFSRVTMMENLSNVSLRAILEHIHAHFEEFLRLPHYKRTNLAEKAVTELVKHQHELYQQCISLDDLLDLAQYVLGRKAWSETSCSM